MVYDGISVDGRTDFHIIRIGALAGRNQTNGMTSVFSGLEPNRECLGYSRQMNYMPFTPFPPKKIQLELERTFPEEWDIIPSCAHQ
ncbi:hypothetical protein TNCV_3376591 [Trichonephila clavipes]|nr:hypothetical protein TNCV_3376591 [Trichonephila clavipes]